MIPRIKYIQALEEFVLFVRFDDGHEVLYDVREDIDAIPDFAPLATTHGLWNQVQLDTSRTCVFWNDRIDLASDSIYEYGKAVPSIDVVAEPPIEYTPSRGKQSR